MQPGHHKLPKWCKSYTKTPQTHSKYDRTPCCTNLNNLILREGGIFLRSPPLIGGWTHPPINFLIPGEPLRTRQTSFFDMASRCHFGVTFATFCDHFVTIVWSFLCFCDLILWCGFVMSFVDDFCDVFWCIFWSCLMQCLCHFALHCQKCDFRLVLCFPVVFGVFSWSLFRFLFVFVVSTVLKIRHICVLFFDLALFMFWFILAASNESEIDKTS